MIIPKRTLFYTFTPTEELSIYTGVGIVLPTHKSAYENEAIDYATQINFNYYIHKNISFFGGYNFTLVKDADVNKVTYQNTNAFQIGVDFPLNIKSNFNISYNNDQSIYSDVEDIKSFGLGYTYYINSISYIGLDYTYGLSDSASDNSLLCSVGYAF
jgi:predicted porin